MNKIILLIVIYILASNSYAQVINTKDKIGIGETTPHKEHNEKASFWLEQQKGTNYFNANPTKKWLLAAHNANIKLVRLTYEKWDGEKRDFLLGNADNYQGIVEADFQKLCYYLDYANKLNLKIVLTPMTLPGARWSQSNGDKRDDRLWKNIKYQKQALQFWKDLASRLKNHSAIVGYDILNEPYPELAYKKCSFWNRGFNQWYKNVKNGPGDLNMFYEAITKSIRSVDKDTPIVLESGLYATPWAFEYLTPIKDNNVIYSFHMYEPYEFTTKKLNKGKFTYPGKIYIKDLGKDFEMNKEKLTYFLKPINDWVKKHNIPSNRIWVGEFGCSRHTKGVEEYLQDLISIFNTNNWHWSFYAFREDVWEDMDYELGTKKVFYKYWEYQESNTLHLNYDIYKREENNRLWQVLKKELE